MLLNLLHAHVSQALETARHAGELSWEHLPEIKLEIPKDTRHGDYATNVALALAKPARKAPRQIAECLLPYLQHAMFERIEIAGPGFLNFSFSWDWLRAQLKESLSQDLASQKQAPADAHHYLLEYVSANPTGALHFGHGRWAVLGDCLARIMRKAGFKVSTEFYINDTGAQIQNLGASVKACYVGHLHTQGLSLSHDNQALLTRYQAEKNSSDKGQVQFYHGASVQILAEALAAEYGLEAAEQPVSFFSDFAKARILAEQQAELAACGVEFDSWFPESRLHAEGAVAAALEELKTANVTYEAEGALWFRSSDYGDDKDRVLVKQDGSSTYFANDIAYHWNKLKRGFDHLINIWGADHHGYIARMQAAVQALGYRQDTLEILLGQIVHLYRNGEMVRMSKRTGEMVTFGEVFEEVGKDATRYLLMQRSADTSVDFDLELAKQQNADNPVFYVQYAHARICSIFRTAQQSEAMALIASNYTQTDLQSLQAPEERALLLKLLAYADEIAFAAVMRAPHRLSHYVEDLAAHFHQFYRQCRVLDEKAPEKSQARLYLAEATRRVLHNALTEIFGISAPESM